MIKSFKYFLEAIIICIFFSVGRILGLTISRQLFSWIFRLAGPFIKSEKIIEKNLNIFSSEFSHEEKKQLKKEMWSNYGMTFIEYMFLNFFRKRNNIVEFEGEKILEKIANEKTPVIFVSGHFANFEIMSMEITKKKVKLATIYRPLNNFFLNPIMEYLRKKYICKNQIKKGRSGVRETMNFIDKGYSIALMIDQRVSEGEKINFFSQPALTTTLPAQLSIKYNIPIVPVFIKREKKDKFKIKFYSPFYSSQFKDKFELTNKLNLELQNMIIKNPKQWIWTHDRWK